MERRFFSLRRHTHKNKHKFYFDEKIADDTIAKSRIGSLTKKRISSSLSNISSITKSIVITNDCLTSSTLTVPEPVEISSTKRLAIGKKKFNIDPKRGIEYLVDNGLLTHTPSDIAQFLLQSNGLNKSMIGQYLCSRNDFNQEVLDEFINQQNFKDLVILEALREYMWSFHPAGDSQKIERVLRGFATRYYSQNPEIWKDAEQCYTIAYSIILLNTLMHNPCVKEKPSKDIFLSLVSKEEGLSQALLDDIYESIKKEPFKKSDGDDLMHTFFNPDKEGWLWKRGGRYKSWKRRWFILTDQCLYYFEYTTDKVPRGIIPLENIKIREVEDKKMSNCFEIYSESSSIIKACKTSSTGKMVEGRHRSYRISAMCPEERISWMVDLKKSTLFSPFYDLLARDKTK